MPLSCKGRFRGREIGRGDIDDALGNFSLTLVDSLDMLAVLGHIDLFEQSVLKVPYIILSYWFFKYFSVIVKILSESGSYRF